MDRIAAEAARYGAKPVPADAVTASASGLDPHISPENARAQAPRVAAARGLTMERVLAVINQVSEGRFLGVLGQPRVNVLRLNRALDALAQSG
jgi:K+-transporting ATPase ATPase C chain